MELTIDTSRPGRVAVQVTRAGAVVARARAAARYHGTQRVLPLVVRVLAVGSRPKSLRGVAVAAAGVGFTQLRAGVVAANALAYAWQVPLEAVSGAPARAAKRHGSRNRFGVRPRYGQAPSATVA